MDITTHYAWLDMVVAVSMFRSNEAFLHSYNYQTQKHRGRELQAQSLRTQLRHWNVWLTVQWVAGLLQVKWFKVPKHWDQSGACQLGSCPHVACQPDMSSQYSPCCCLPAAWRWTQWTRSTFSASSHLSLLNPTTRKVLSKINEKEVSEALPRIINIPFFLPERNHGIIY